jgi:FG-GAP-like repeat
MIQLVTLLLASMVAGCASAPGPATPSASASASLDPSPSASASPTPSPSASASPWTALFRAPVHLATPPGDSIVVDHFNGDGNLDIAGVNDDGGVSLLIGSGGGAFDPAVVLPGGTGPGAIAAADVDLDGRLDIVLTHSGATDRGVGSDDIVVLLSRGDGTFDTLIRAAGVNPQAVVAGDFNADQKPDLATANDGENLSIFLGNGDGTFRDPHSFPVGAPYASGIAVSDFNGDGKQDLTTTNSLIGRGRGDRSVSILLGRGDGTFNAPDVYKVGGPQPMMPVVADLNGDGSPDIAAPGGYPTTNVSVLLGLGDGRFSPAIESTTGPNPHTIVVADLDGDGHQDLVTGNLGENGGPVGKGIAILFGVGDGTFEPKVDLSGGDLGEGIGAAADLDGDGNIDLIEIGGAELVLYFNTGGR